MSLVLLVDDDEDQMCLRRMVLERDGHEVLTSAAPEDALKVFEDRSPALVVMDLRLPTAAHGLALIRKLRVLSVEVRIVVISGWMEDLLHAPEVAMVDHCLRKPVGSQQMLRAVKRLTGTSGEA